MRSTPIQQIYFTVLLIGLCFSTIQAQDTDKRKAPSPPNVIHRSGDVLQREAIHRVEPVYPPLASAAKISGPVVIEITVDEQGEVSAARVLSGHPLLKDAAVTAAKQWKFKPAVLSGTPVRVIGSLTFNFSLPGVTPGSGGEESRVKSLEELENQVKENPSSGKAHYELGTAYNKARRSAEAITSLKEAVRLDPESAATHYELGLAYMRSERPAEAAESFRQALKVDPNHGNNDATYMGLGMVSLQLEQYEEAINAFQESIKISPFIAESHLGLGVSRFMLGRIREALPALQRAVELNNNDPSGHFYLGLAYVETGDKKLAMKEYEIVKKMHAGMAELLLKVINFK